MKWHKERFYGLIFDAGKRSLRFPVVLPETPPAMYEDFKKFVESRHDRDYYEYMIKTFDIDRDQIA